MKHFMSFSKGIKPGFKIEKEREKEIMRTRKGKEKISNILCRLYKS